MQEVVELVVEDDRIVGKDGGFLAIRRMRLRNRRADDSLSREYLCDFIVRPKGVDAVVVAVFCRAGGAIRVLLRDGLRPALAFGRAGESPPVPDRREYMYFREVCAGIVEAEDRGETGLRQRAAIEVQEEAGYAVEAGAVVMLGAGTFPTPGAMAERFWLSAVEIADPSAQQVPQGDGSPMEEGARTEWLELDAAIAACVAGDIEDAKTELCLRRLRDHLARK
jgi:ADP-ribose pyrophosphatase